MPQLTRWSIKAALLYFVAALALAVAIAARPVLGLPPWLSTLEPLFVHLLVVGWLTQLIFGVAYWMFPNFSKGRPYRSERLAWVMFALLNLGLLLRVAAEVGQSSAPGGSPLWLFVLSAAAQWLAGVAFAVNTWGRVRAR